jgi:hypothetical protein
VCPVFLCIGADAGDRVDALDQRGVKDLRYEHPSDAQPTEGLAYESFNTANTGATIPQSVNRNAIVAWSALVARRI